MTMTVQCRFRIHLSGEELANQSSPKAYLLTTRLYPIPSSPLCIEMLVTFLQLSLEPNQPTYIFHLSAD